jgi:hypothetical protein
MTRRSRSTPIAGDLDAVRESFDAAAEAYAQVFADELSRKPFDRERLDDLAAATGPMATFWTLARALAAISVATLPTEGST